MKTISVFFLIAKLKMPPHKLDDYLNGSLGAENKPDVNDLRSRN
jgi:hypothetical protein